MDDPRDAEIIELRERIYALEESAALDAVALKSEVYLANLVASGDAERERRKRYDGYKIPSRVYELLEDVGRISSAIEVLDAVWHKNEVRGGKRKLMAVLKFFRAELQDFL